MMKEKILGGRKKEKTKAEGKQGVQSGLLVGTCQVALNRSGDISVAAHTSDVCVTGMHIAWGENRRL